MRATHTTKVACLAIVAAILAALAGAGPAGAATADCQPFAKKPCLLPFPSNLFTKRDKSSVTGLRVHLPAGAMPVNSKGSRVSVAPYDRSDGFSPGSAIIIHIRGLDNARAFSRTGAAPLANMGRSLRKRQPIVLIDERTGKRQLIWSELDANQTAAADINLLVHPGKNLLEGHTYVVALRNLRTARGKLIKAPAWFERLRDGRPLPRAERSQRAHYARIFAALTRAGIARSNLYEAWDFTVASRQNLTSRMLAIRNNAFAQLGDTNLADVSVQGNAPSYLVTSVSTLTPQIKDVQGTFQVPCYLLTCGLSATTGFHYSSSRPDATPTQIHGNVATALFECIVPSTASASTPARISLYGHGLLGSRTEVHAGNVEDMAIEHNMVFCATDWWGLAEQDTAYDITALQDINNFPNVVDRLQQGVLNTLFLGRLMLNPQGFASNPTFRTAPRPLPVQIVPGPLSRPLIDTSHLYYDGNSQGGVMGGMTTALAPDFQRAGLGVSGMDYGNLLVQRSTDFAPFGQLLFGSYTDKSMDPVILDLMQQLWDRGDPDGYAEQMTPHPLPDTPSHTVLMQIAYGDHQVSMYSAAVEARTIGASVHEPALDLSTNRGRDRNLFFGIPAIAHYPFGGSAIVIWDSGPGRVQPPPLANLAPQDAATNHDPHEDVRDTKAARTQKSDFLAPNGSVVDVCGGKPCHTDACTP
ncbi:MAG: hypothetical protein ACXVR2_08540 [Solirubrobacteraceae bacterium]